MYKLYIVDDEPYVIEGIRKCIDWEKRGITIVGSATNGLTACSEILSLQPDVVIIDIKMPSMDGISVINKIKTMLPDIAFIIISGYDDFQYAKQAIQAHVVDYLVKPAAAEEILEAVSRALAQIHLPVRSIDYTSPDYWRIIENVFSNPTTDIRSAGCYYVIIPETLELSTIRKRVPEFEVNTSSGTVHCTFMELLDHHLAILYAMHPLSEEDLLNVASHIRNNLEVFLTDETDSLRIGISTLKRLQDLKKGYYEAQEALEYCQWTDISDCCFDRISYTQVDISRSEIWPELQNAVRTGDAKKASSLLSDQFDAFSRCRITPADLKEFCLKAYMLIRDKALDFDQIDPILEINSLRSINDSRSYILNLYRNHFDCLHAAPSGAPQSHFVKEVLAYIHAHYQEPITLYDISEYMHKSNSYISSRFKKEFGGSFSQYLNDYRLLQARMLLISSNMKVKEVAVAVGFSDEQYFSNVFKKEFGMTPGGYRKIYQT